MVIIRNGNLAINAANITSIELKQLTIWVTTTAGEELAIYTNSNADFALVVYKTILIKLALDIKSINIEVIVSEILKGIQENE